MSSLLVEVRRENLITPIVTARCKDYKCVKK